MNRPYAMVFEPILKQKVWGGRRLSRYGKVLTGTDADGPRFGESWEIADLATTSVSGGGGAAAISVILNGALAGKSIADAMAAWGADLLGADGIERAAQFGEQAGAGRPVFPLLIKYLDAGEHLSVQVHPSPEYAAAHRHAHLKTESWFVLEAEASTRPDGTGVEPCVFVGLSPGVDEERFRGAIGEGSAADLLRAIPARRGDCHTLPSGTVHALGAGVLVAEVQTPSDTTFRVYDWAHEYRRADRELHIDDAVACIDFADGALAAPCVRAEDGGRAAQTAYYTIESVVGDAGFTPGRMAVVMVHAGRGVVTGAGEDVAVAAGSTVLIPASRAADARLAGGDGLRALVIEL